jgi:hypothetical protein
LLAALATIATDSLKKLSVFNSGDVLSQKTIRQLVFNAKQPNTLLEKLFVGANDGPLCGGVDDRAITLVCEHFEHLKKLVLGSAAISDVSLLSLSHCTRYDLSPPPCLPTTTLVGLIVHYPLPLLFWLQP